MNELTLKYGCNPNQTPAKIFMKNGGNLPIEVLNGTPGYINFMDAFNGWQLVRELKAATGLPAATSFKHVSPAGAAIGKPLSDVLKKIYFIQEDMELSPLACAYARARGADRMSSLGDFIALSDICDIPTAKLIKNEISDGIIAPGYEAEALEILKSKKKGNYNIIKIDENYIPAAIENKDIFGITFEQGRNELKIDNSVLQNIVSQNKDLSNDAKNDLILSLITLKYTQSNSVCYAKDGQATGIGAGQQSRIHCTRLAGDKSDNWHLRQCPKVLSLPFIKGKRPFEYDNAIDLYISGHEDDILADGVWQTIFSKKPDKLTKQEKQEWLSKQTGVSLGSDAFFPFADSVERAKKSGVSYIIEPGGSMRDDDVIKTCDKYGIVLVFNGIRLFHH